MLGLGFRSAQSLHHPAVRLVYDEDEGGKGGGGREGMGEKHRYTLTRIFSRVLGPGDLDTNAFVVETVWAGWAQLSVVKFYIEFN